MSPFSFEDLRPGTRFAVGTLVLPPTDTGTPLPFAQVLVSLLEAFTESELFVPGALDITAFEWRRVAHIAVGQHYSVDVEVTNRNLDARGVSGIVGMEVVLSDTAGSRVHEGRCEAGVATVDPLAALELESVHPSFASPAWINELERRLQDDDVLATAAATFDGSVALHFGASSMGLRLYRGKVIDTGRSIVGGATFSIHSSCATWLDFARRPRNEFISFAMGDQFDVRGSTYEYLRMTRVIMVITDQVRAMLREEFARA